MHHRLFNELVHRLVRRALSAFAPLLREEECRHAFDELYASFRDEILWYETQRERMRQRLGRPEPKQPPDGEDD